MRSLVTPFVLLGLPLAEIAGFVIVGRALGVALTLLLVLLSAVAGVALLRIKGLGVLRRVQEAARSGVDPGLDVIGGALIFIAAVLLIVPGFLTDIIGLLLLLPPARRLLADALRTRMTILTDTGFYTSGRRNEQSKGSVIDLDEDEFSRKEKDENGPPANRISH